MKFQRTVTSALLALGLTALIAAPALAQYRNDRGYRDNGYRDNQSSFSIQLNFNRAPHWQRVPGTRVLVVRDYPGYDMFRYGNEYYVYRYNRWYVSDNWRGEFRYVDAGSVPYEFRRVPRRSWHNYPPEWRRGNRDRNNWDDRYHN